MSYKPGRRKCDMCEQTLDEATPSPIIWLPLTPPELERLASELAAIIPEPLRQLGGSLMPQALPSHYRFDFCNGCTDGFMPMMDELRRKAVAGLIERWQRRSERETVKKFRGPDDDD